MYCYIKEAVLSTFRFQVQAVILDSKWTNVIPEKREIGADVRQDENSAENELRNRDKIFQQHCI